MVYGYIVINIIDKKQEEEIILNLLSVRWCVVTQYWQSKRL